MTTTPAAPDDAELAALTQEIESWVRHEGEAWAERIERERAGSPELWEELDARGYTRLAAPVQLGGRGLAFTQYLPLLELFAMSHGSVRMIVHVANGVWRSLGSKATPEQGER